MRFSIPLTLLCIFLLACACKNSSNDSKATLPTAIPNNIQTKTLVYSIVDNLNLRETPGTTGTIVARVAEGDSLTLTGEQTDYTEKIKLRDMEYDKPWVQVQTHDGKTGWVYGGALRSSTTVASAVKTVDYERLDRFDLNSLKKIAADRQSEAGDCSTNISRYALEGQQLVVRSSDCGDYGKHDTYYLLNSANTIQMVHVRDIEPFYNEKDKGHYYNLSEKIIDLKDGISLVKARSGTIAQNTLATKVARNTNYHSEPWITLNGKGDDYVLGEKIDYKSDWYATAKKALVGRLVTMDALPKEIPLKISNEILMGTRGEFRSLCDEAIQEAVSHKEYDLRQEQDPFKRFNIMLELEASPGEEGTLAYWQKQYGAL